ncbi:MAG: exopolysaccharide biosynthesis polyprenyl glycosylphosphotransferase [Sphingomonadaceae bacterium]
MSLQIRPLAQTDMAPPVLPASPVPVASLESKRLRAYLVLAIADYLGILLCFVLASKACRYACIDEKTLLRAELLAPVFLLIALYHSAYSIRALTDFRFAITRMTGALIISATLLGFMAFYTKPEASISRTIFAMGLLYSTLALALIRYTSVRVIRHYWGADMRNVLIIDDGGPDFQLPRTMRINAIDLELSPAKVDPHGLDQLGRYLANQDQVIVSCPRDRAQFWAFILRAAGVRGELISDAAEMLGVSGIHRYDNTGRTGLVVSTGPLALRARAVKRAFDLIVAALALVLLSPLFLVCAIAIKLDDGGPVFFVQRRVGYGNRFFDMLKFRSMRVDCSDEEGRCSVRRDDERITRIGAVLRRTSMDELPQLINVLRADMSIVGSRPHALGSQAGTKLFWEVDGQYWRRHSLRPGLTGLAQIRGQRGATEQESDLAARLDSDLEYIANWSLAGDIVILFRTFSVLWHERAY